MLYEKEFIQSARLSCEKDTIIKFGENLEFTCPKLEKNDGPYKIENVKGDFVIRKITRNYGDGSKYDVVYNKTKNEFYHPEGYSPIYSFYVAANISMIEISAITHQLQIFSARLHFLKHYQYFKGEFVLPDYDDLKFVYFVKKIDASTENDIEIHVENPYDVEIQGKQGDFKIEQSSSKNIDLILSFGFDPSIAVNDENGEVNDEFNTDQASISDLPLNAQSEPVQTFVAVDESRPESVIEAKLSNSNETKLLHKIRSNHLFSDVIFIASDGTKIPSHRCILAELSKIFMQIFKESTEIPVQINVDDFDTETVQSALNFLYDKPDEMKRKEIEIFKFAVKFGIQNLIEACCSFFEESVDPSNVCDYVQIAYSNNFDSLKQKCLNVLVEKKKEINPTKKSDLPKNILLDAYCF